MLSGLFRGVAASFPSGISVTDDRILWAYIREDPITRDLDRVEAPNWHDFLSTLIT